MVDRYWNGTRSLHKNYKFLGQANQLLTDEYKAYSNANQTLHYENEITLLKNKIKSMAGKNAELSQKLVDNEANVNTKPYLNEIVS